MVSWWTEALVRQGHHFSLARRHAPPHLTTLHGRLNLSDLLALYQEFWEIPVMSISQVQRELLPWLDRQGTVHHGLPIDLSTFEDPPGHYLAFLGRISPEKRVAHALEIALRAGLPLKIAVKVDPVDRAYCETVVKPLLQEPVVEYVGEVGDRCQR